ncbi:sulfurtransferase [Leptospira kobayashii]|uniref:Sulfurtransferase n=1 Tax=Leptospira kobayashii TaxID=1917830 RepID=A0ABN6KC92_9LEPT|nr:sulfurtransferase [Leptospira kobayashii]BDA78607.1 sulfurtransferase [Leptospira kobayashii]
MIVSTDWLFSQLGNADVRIVDIRGRVETSEPRYHAEKDAYQKEHIPGAVFVDWTKDIVDLDDPVPVNIAPSKKFKSLMESLGIGENRLVVAYDDHNSMFAGRLAWALRYYGHENVKILDGGFRLWKLEGRPVNSEIPSYPKANFIPNIRTQLRLTADEVQFRSSDTLLIDARRPEVYANGFIPGAVNLPHPTLIDPETGKFHPVEQLKKAFADAGIDSEKLPQKIMLYCNGGASATVPLTALALLGRKDANLYDGSWNEWGKDPNRPKGKIES